MSRPASNFAVGLRSQGTQFWRGRAPRERLLLGAAGALLLIGLVWWLLVQPAWRTLREAPVEIDRLEAQLQFMRSLAMQSEGWRSAPPVSPTQAAAALKAATERLGAAARMTLVGDRATLTLSGVDAEALRAWLQEARGGARARPVEAQLTRNGAGYDGNLVVVLGGAP